MEEDKRAIIQMLDLIEHGIILKMIREIVTWLLDHQDDLI